MIASKGNLMSTRSHRVVRVVLRRMAGVSLAMAHAAANAKQIPLYASVGGPDKTDLSLGGEISFVRPRDNHLIIHSFNP